MSQNHLTFSPDHLITDAKICIVVARFNDHINDLLLSGAKSSLLALGYSPNAIQVHYAPGAVELPFLCQQLAIRGGIDGIVALGTVIRGDTPHFDFVSDSAITGLLNVSLAHNLPIVSGILTTNTEDQALQRAKHENEGGLNKGREVTYSLLEMIQAQRALTTESNV